jgi:hypothetical protein
MVFARKFLQEPLLLSRGPGPQKSGPVIYTVRERPKSNSFSWKIRFFFEILCIGFKTGVQRGPVRANPAESRSSREKACFGTESFWFDGGGEEGGVIRGRGASYW